MTLNSNLIIVRTELKGKLMRQLQDLCSCFRLDTNRCHDLNEILSKIHGPESIKQTGDYQKHYMIETEYGTNAILSNAYEIINGSQAFDTMDKNSKEWQILRKIRTYLRMSGFEV